MKIDFKNPRYIIPLIAVPFLCLFFFVYRQSISKKQTVRTEKDISGNLAEISDQVRERGLSDKLEAYKNSYKEADGYSAIKAVGEDLLPQATMASSYSDREKNRLDSIEESIKRQAYLPMQQSRKPLSGYSPARTESGIGTRPEDRAVAQALASLAEARNRERPPSTGTTKETDPMDLFKKQMAYIDSMQKVNDPAYIDLQKEKKIKVEELIREEKVLPVSRKSAVKSEFNTLLADESREMITAIIDEDVTGYSGSRIRLRLLEEVYVGKLQLPKGTYMYARISGFSEQRVQLEISSVLCAGKVLPIKLLIYDMDGLPGLYVPASAFREFSKGLGSSPVQGFNTMGSGQGQNEFVMSTIDRLFQSSSSAIANMVRKNRAKLKYNNQVFLVDPQDLQGQN
ncbi:conjugative transposon TraM protein [Pedobacter sp. W3I1]|uniref:conjugative transposon protein TraM n=1 Tax=Pedobacter sp. W3I1 TaxID=3042291 RepID=UPI00277F306A|nr:conjugative transposon protein TraM [Pedobacter sp. W3I1]MDQ0640150.1 conjugative transposon TraM protein [Pedobacter sp. W3I1]